MSLQGQMLRIHSKRFWVGEQRDATVYGVVVRVFVHRGSGEIIRGRGDVRRKQRRL